MLNIYQIILIIVLIFVIIYLLLNGKENYKNEKIELKDIFIYVIHKESMAHRLDRFLNILKTKLPENKYKIIEPISTENVEKMLDEYLKNDKITLNAYHDIQNKNKVRLGSQTLKSLSLALTNISIWGEELNKKRYFMILEDDFIFYDYTINILNNILNNLPNQWDLIYLSCHINKSHYHLNKINNHLIKINTRVHGQGALLYNYKSLPILIENIFPLNLQIDHDIPDKFIMNHKLNAYIAVNKFLDTIIHNDNYFYGSSTQL
jgi:hypothetical protein